jgi:TonB family protein
VPRILFVLLLALPFAHSGWAAGEWPHPVVTIEEMTPLTPLRISVPWLRPKGEVTRPAILRVHVGTDGSVRRVALHESSGSPAHDEAALHGMRDMRFAPKLVEGEARDVTLVVPLHLPLSKTARQ